jgi:hypothetical protein
MVRGGITFPLLTDVLRPHFADILTQPKAWTDSRISLQPRCRSCRMRFPDWRSHHNKSLAVLLLLAALASCAAPAPEPVNESAVLEPGVACRASRDGGPTLAERGIGGTGAPSRMQIVDRGIGGTGIVGIVTGFASICVDGLEVRFDRTVPVFINGTAATTGQLRIGQLVAINAVGPPTASDSVAQARTISVRYEVSGPIEAIDIHAGAIMVAGQRVLVLPSTWVAGRFGMGNWITVSGLRQPDGAIVASRLDHARAGALAVRGQIERDHDTTHIGGLVLRGPAAAITKPGTYVSVMGRYVDGIAEVTSIDPDYWLQDPADYFGTAAGQLIVQGFVRVASSTVWLNNGQQFKAGPHVQGNGNLYRNAVVWLTRMQDGSFTATELHYTSYRAQPKAAPPRAGGHGTNDEVLPPYLPPWPPLGAPPANVPDTNTDAGTPPAAEEPTGIIAPADAPTSGSAPPHAEPPADGALITGRRPFLPSPTTVAKNMVARN